MILQNYLWTAQSFFTPEEVARIHKAADKLPLNTSMIGQENQDADSDTGAIDEGIVDEDIRQGGNKWFVNEEGHMPQDIVEKIRVALKTACDECDWHHTIEYQENPQYTIYDAQPEKKKGDFYTWHTVARPIKYDNGMHRKLSMTIQLSDSDDYEGGHFQWLEPQRKFDRLTDDLKIDLTDSVRTIPHSAKQIGSVVVFPSFVYHQVTPVTKGTRKSLVVWFVGKPYV